MTDENIKTLTEEEVVKLKSLEKAIRDAEKELVDYKFRLIREHGCSTPLLGILSYSVTNWRKKETKEYTMLAYISRYTIVRNEIVPHYSHVSADGKCGNAIDKSYKDNMVFVPLEDTNIEEAKRILKDVKKKKQLI